MKKFIVTVFIIIQIYILSLLLFAVGSTDHYIKRLQLYPNVVYALAGLVITVVTCALLIKCRHNIEDGFQRWSHLIVAVTITVFFFAAVFLCINGFFFSDWDPAAILYGVYGVLHGHPEHSGATYFSNHPNNLLLVWIYLLVLRITGLFGTDSPLALVIFQCLLSSTGAFVFYRILSDLTEDVLASYAGLIIYEIWIVLSPWFIITYSDEVGLLFPILILRLYQKAETPGINRIRRLLYSAAISALAAAGYFIKPQIVLAFLAINIFYILDIKLELKDRLKYVGAGIAALAVFALIIKSLIIPSLGIDTDSSRSFGMAHYFMMGLNDKTDGAYSDEDTLYTDSFDTPSKKREADLKVANERIREYGINGLWEHSKNKTLVNFNDGLFAWGVDGNFFSGREMSDIGDIPKTGATETIWSFIMPEGRNHGKYSSFHQMIWLTVLLLGLVAAIRIFINLFSSSRNMTASTDHKDTKSLSELPDNILYAVMLSLVFLFCFELIFEAKARYLIIYLPYYLIMAEYGVWSTAHKISITKKTD